MNRQLSITAMHIHGGRLTGQHETRPILEELKAQHGENFGWALNCCSRDRDLAEDSLQESYLRVLDGRAQFADKSALKTWFFAVIRTVAREMQNAGKRREILNLKAIETNETSRELSRDSETETPQQLTELEQSNVQLLGALQQLPERQREVLHLVFYAQYTLEECAKVLGVTTGSARTHYHRGKGRLAELLNLERYDDS